MVRKATDVFSRVPSAPVTSQEKEKSLKRIAKGVYSGEEKRAGIPHGKGILMAKSGSGIDSWQFADLIQSATLLARAVTPSVRSYRHSFEGVWENGEMHGTGRCQSPSGRTYTGEWCMGKITGKGKQTYGNGIVEAGIFR